MVLTSSETLAVTVINGYMRAFKARHPYAIKLWRVIAVSLFILVEPTHT